VSGRHGSWPLEFFARSAVLPPNNGQPVPCGNVLQGASEKTDGSYVSVSLESAGWTTVCVEPLDGGHATVRVFTSYTSFTIDYDVTPAG
jgi:hypothetical protein